MFETSDGFTIDLGGILRERYCIHGELQGEENECTVKKLAFQCQKSLKPGCGSRKRRKNAIRLSAENKAKPSSYSLVMRPPLRPA
jgi:hypothetical protein